MLRGRDALPRSSCRPGFSCNHATWLPGRPGRCRSSRRSGLLSLSLGLAPVAETEAGEPPVEKGHLQAPAGVVKGQTQLGKIAELSRAEVLLHLGPRRVVAPTTASVVQGLVGVDRLLDDLGKALVTIQGHDRLPLFLGELVPQRIHPVLEVLNRPGAGLLTVQEQSVVLLLQTELLLEIVHGRVLVRKMSET